MPSLQLEFDTATARTLPRRISSAGLLEAGMAQHGTSKMTGKVDNINLPSGTVASNGV